MGTQSFQSKGIAYGSGVASRKTKHVTLQITCMNDRNFMPPVWKHIASVDLTLRRD